MTTEQMLENNILFLTQGKWTEKTICKIRIDEFVVNVLHSSFVAKSDSQRDKHTIHRENLSQILQVMETDNFQVIVGDCVDVMILKYLYRKQLIHEIPALLMTLEPQFKHYEEIGELIGKAYNENPARDIALAPDVFWFYQTEEFYDDFIQYGIAPDHLAYFPSCTFVHALMNPNVDEYINHSPAQEHPTTGKVRGCILSAGIFNRDYLTFIGACAGLNMDAFILTDFETLVSIQGSETKKRLETALENAPNVHTCAAVPLQDYIDCLRHAGIIVVPLLEDNFTTGHLTISDALRLGRPVIAANFSCARDFIQHGKNGLLYEPGNSGSLREQLLTLIDNPNFAEELGKCGQKREMEISSGTREAFLTLARKAVARG